MLSAGKAVKVSIYVSDGATRHGAPVYSAILDFLFYRGVSGATALKGLAGFGHEHQMHSSAGVEISDRLPIKIEFIESREKVDELLPKLQEMAGSGLIEMQETAVVKPPERPKPRAVAMPEHLKIEGKARMMRILVGDEERWRDKPLHEALVEAMRANDIAGVTVYRGVAGYNRQRKEAGSRHGAYLLVAVDAALKLEAFLPVLDQMVEEGMVIFSDVDVVKYAFRAPEESMEALP
jgi:PII-like signaling protein